MRTPQHAHSRILEALWAHSRKMGNHDFLRLPQHGGWRRQPRGIESDNRVPARDCWACCCQRRRQPQGAHRYAPSQSDQQASSKKRHILRIACGYKGPGRCASPMCGEFSWIFLIYCLYCFWAMIFSIMLLSVGLVFPFSCALFTIVAMTVGFFMAWSRFSMQNPFLHSVRQPSK